MRAPFAVALALVFAAAAPAKDLRLRSPDGRFVAVYRYAVSDPELVESVSFVSSAGEPLFADDFTNRDYRPEKGRWSRSGRFFVYSLLSEGGHSPWRKPFVVAYMQSRRLTRDAEIHDGTSISEFRLSGRDTLSYKILDTSTDDWSSGVPGIPVRFSLSQKLTSK